MIGTKSNTAYLKAQVLALPRRRTRKYMLISRLADSGLWYSIQCSYLIRGPTCGATCAFRLMAKHAANIHNLRNLKQASIRLAFSHEQEKKQQVSNI